MPKIHNQLLKVRDKYVLIANSIRMNDKSKENIYEAIMDIYEYKVIPILLTVKGKFIEATLVNKNDTIEEMYVIIDGRECSIPMKDGKFNIGRVNGDLNFQDKDNIIYTVEEIKEI